MEIMDIIRKRRSIRSFLQKPIAKEDIMEMMEAARLAPSGMNLQPLKFICVSSKEYTDKLFPLTRWAGYTAPKGVPTLSDAPTAYIVVLIDENIRKEGDNDAAYASENIILLAESKGIASCILGAIEREKIKELLNVEEKLRVHTVIALGYPNQKSSVFDMEDTHKYYVDENGNFCVPKRSIEEISKFI